MKCSETRMGSQQGFQHAELSSYFQCNFLWIPPTLLTVSLHAKFAWSPLPLIRSFPRPKPLCMASVPPIISRASFKRFRRILFTSLPNPAAFRSASANNSSILFASTQATIILSSSLRLSCSAFMRRRFSSSRCQIICLPSHSCSSISALRSLSSTSRAMVAASRFSSLTIAESLPGKSPALVSRHCCCQGASTCADRHLKRQL